MKTCAERHYNHKNLVALDTNDYLQRNILLFLYMTEEEAKLLGKINQSLINKKRKKFTKPKKQNLTKQTFAFSLSARELEVLTLLCDGFQYKEIAKQLYISEKTVKKHTSNIFSKLIVNDRTQAVIKALKNGLVQIEGINKEIKTDCKNCTKLKMEGVKN